MKYETDNDLVLPLAMLDYLEKEAVEFDNYEMIVILRRVKNSLLYFNGRGLSNVEIATEIINSLSKKGVKL